MSITDTIHERRSGLPEEPKRSCNRHSDCEAAEARVLAANPGLKKAGISLTFHCHDEDCEDCFGC